MGSSPAFDDLPNLQGTWETNPSRATADRAVLTSYEGAVLGAAETAVQPAAAAFLTDADALFPGVAAAARREGDGNVIAHREHWLSNRLALGSYPCNQPGYFTTIADNEGKPVGNVFFAGDQASVLRVAGLHGRRGHIRRHRGSADPRSAPFAHVVSSSNRDRRARLGA